MLFAGLLILLCGFCYLPFWTTTDGRDNRAWCLLLLPLVYMARQSPSPWIAASLVWLGTLPLWTAIGKRCGLLPMVAPQSLQIDMLALVLGWSVIYIGASQVVTAPMLAWLLLGFATALSAHAWAWEFGWKPWPWRREKTQDPTLSRFGREFYTAAGPGWIGSWFCSVGMLAALYLIMRDDSWSWLAALLIPLPVTLIWRARTLTAPIAAFVGSLILLPWIAAPLILLAIVAFWRMRLSYEVGRGSLHTLLQRRAPWAIAWEVSRKSHFWGTGLGCWWGMGVVTSPDSTYQEPEKNHVTVWHWEQLHNDWLQALLETGPLVPLCALGYLGTHMLAFPVDLVGRFAFSLVMMIALYAITHFPLHVPGHAAVAALAAGLLDMVR